MARDCRNGTGTNWSNNSGLDRRMPSAQAMSVRRRLHTKIKRPHLHLPFQVWRVCRQTSSVWYLLHLRDPISLVVADHKSEHLKVQGLVHKDHLVVEIEIGFQIRALWDAGVVDPLSILDKHVLYFLTSRPRMGVKSQRTMRVLMNGL